MPNDLFNRNRGRQGATKSRNTPDFASRFSMGRHRNERSREERRLT